MKAPLSLAEAQERIALVRSASREDRGSFTRLVERSRLDPAKDLRFGNFSGVDFSGCDLRGYDFTGASLVKCSFLNSRIHGAIFTQAEFSHCSGENGNAFDLSAADDFREAFGSGRADVPSLLDTRFDEHIKIGAYFRDHLSYPLMRALVAIQSNGSLIKIAVASSREAVEEWRMRIRLPDEESKNRMIDQVSGMNGRLGLPRYFWYQRIGEFAVSVGATGTPETFNADDVSDREKPLELAKHSEGMRNSALGRAWGLARRMRSSGCAIPRST